MDRLRNFGFLIKDVGRLYTKLYEERARRFEVTLPQCKALAHLSKNQGVSQIRLAELADIDPMTLVRILDRMEADGWIERRAHSADRRVRQLYLTDKAKPILDQIWKVGDEIRAEVFKGFKAEERNLMLDLLERAHANLLELRPNLDSSSALDKAAGRGSPAKSAKKSARSTR